MPGESSNTKAAPTLSDQIDTAERRVNNLLGMARDMSMSLVGQAERAPGEDVKHGTSRIVQERLSRINDTLSEALRVLERLHDYVQPGVNAAGPRVLSTPELSELVASDPRGPVRYADSATEPRQGRVTGEAVVDGPVDPALAVGREVRDPLGRGPSRQLRDTR